ncbi:MAG: hypothetical protein WAN50_00950 [Minisyncoccia bacterium]
MKNLHRVFVLWVPFVVAITGIFGFSYLAVQQNYRQLLNDPQIQIAEDAAVSLARDYTPANVIAPGTPAIDIASSLDSWTAIYDSSGTPLESSGILDGAPPRLPAGLFDMNSWRSLKYFSAPTGPETRVTWQPRADVRQAVVLVRFNTSTGVGYVTVGRSMRVVEDRIADLTHLAAVAWGVTVLATLAVLYILAAFGWL